MPIIINMVDNVIVQNGLNFELKYFNDSGIKSNMDIHIITPDANAHEEDIILFWFLIFINIGIKPIRVANPAREVRINEYNIWSPNKWYDSELIFFSVKYA